MGVLGWHLFNMYGLRCWTGLQKPLSRVPLSNLYTQRDLGNVLGGTQGKLFGPSKGKIGTQRRWEWLSCISCAVKMLRKSLCMQTERSQINNRTTFHYHFWTCPNTLGRVHGVGILTWWVIEIWGPRQPLGWTLLVFIPVLSGRALSVRKWE